VGGRLARPASKSQCCVRRNLVGVVAPMPNGAHQPAGARNYCERRTDGARSRADPWGRISRSAQACRQTAADSSASGIRENSGVFRPGAAVAEFVRIPASSVRRVSNCRATTATPSVARKRPDSNPTGKGGRALELENYSLEPSGYQTHLAEPDQSAFGGKRVLRGVGVTHPAKRRQRGLSPCD
jgi:hypothetical protein